MLLVFCLSELVQDMSTLLNDFSEVNKTFPGPQDYGWMKYPDTEYSSIIILIACIEPINDDNHLRIRAYILDRVVPQDILLLSHDSRPCWKWKECDRPVCTSLDHVQKGLL
jgi:hypothetical protein